MIRTAYISGPMRGRRQYNFPNFDRVAERFQEMGFRVINPAELDRIEGFDPVDLPDDHDWNSTDRINLREAFRRDTSYLSGAATDIVMLDGWENSKGARAERALAVALGLTILDERGALLNPDERPEVIGRPETANPKDAIGSRKPQLHLIPPVADVAECRVMQLGASKYGPYNWRETAVRASVYVSALRRHLAQWFDGEDVDAESGQSHLAHARANLSILLDAQACGKLIDDRPPAGGACEALATKWLGITDEHLTGGVKVGELPE